MLAAECSLQEERVRGLADILNVPFDPRRAVICLRLPLLVFLVTTLACVGRVTAQTAQQPPQAEHKVAEKQLKKEEKQRILGIFPAFTSSDNPNAAKLSPGQKFELAFKTATDPFFFFVAGVDAGLSQWENDFPEYGQGADGYAKRFGASYADSFEGTLFGTAIFPVMLRQDPRYFRKGTGSFNSRLWHAIGSTVICKGDNGRWQPNYSNVLGNLAAGGISNAYYPQADRGAALTFERAFTVTAEGAIGSVFFEFWPDISRKLAQKHHAKP